MIMDLVDKNIKMAIIRLLKDFNKNTMKRGMKSMKGTKWNVGEKKYTIRNENIIE